MSCSAITRDHLSRATVALRYRPFSQSSLNGVTCDLCFEVNGWKMREKLGD